MSRNTKNLVFPIGYNLNSINCLKSLIIALLFMSYCVPFAFAADHNSAAFYKENKKLNDLFANEGFKVGLPCDQVAKIYNLEIVSDRGQRTRLESSQIGVGEGKNLVPGFFRGDCYSNEFDYVQKIVSVNDNEFDHTPVFESFIEQYGRPDFQQEGLSDIRYYVRYTGKFVEFSLTIRRMAEQVVLIYELEDRTSKIKQSRD